VREKLLLGLVVLGKNIAAVNQMRAALATEEKTEGLVADRADWLYYCLLGMAIVALLHAFYAFGIGLFHPLIRNAFREPQTALSAFWIWKGGPLLSYETPVLGAPWSIPFEFPVYQWIVALLRCFGIPIDVGGKLVSFAFYLGCIACVRTLFRSLGLNPAVFLIFAILFLTSPFYMYWSGAVLIESCALFFGCLWLACTAVFFRRPRLRNLVFACTAGTLCILVKSTTHPAFAVLCGLLVLVEAARWLKGKTSLSAVAAGAVICTFPLLPGFAWIAVSEAVRDANPIGPMLSNIRLRPWMVGTLEQRLSVAPWRDIVGGRMLVEAFGYSLPIAGLLTGAAAASPRYILLWLAAILAFFTPLLILLNLHLMHGYYQYSFMIFAFASVAFSIAAIADHRALRPLALFAVLVIAISQVNFFYRAYAPVFNPEAWNAPVIRIALAAKQSTSQDQGLIVFGNDWSSIIPYYSERKALVIPPWAPQATFDELFKNPKRLLGNLDLGGVIVCFGDLDEYGANRTPIEALTDGKKVLAETETCKLYSAGG
jgi:hypothetical protein